MIRSFSILLCALFLSSSSTAQPQQPAPAPLANPPQPSAPKTAAPAPDFSQEPFVIEKYTLTTGFENDGTGERSLRSRIKVQSDAGVQQLAELIFGYNSANEKIDVHFVRVIKPDGSTTTAKPDAIKEMTAPVERGTCSTLGVCRRGRWGTYFNPDVDRAIAASFGIKQRFSFGLCVGDV